MTPRPTDAEVVQVKLRHIAHLRYDLQNLGEMSEERLTTDPLSRHAESGDNDPAARSHRSPRAGGMDGIGFVHEC